MHEGKSPLGKLRAYPVSLASGKPHLVRLSLFSFGLSELGSNLHKKDIAEILRLLIFAFTIIIVIALFVLNRGSGW
jgi:hypothetical protein